MSVEASLEAAKTQVAKILDPAERDKYCLLQARFAASKNQWKVVELLVSNIADQSAKDKCCVEATKWAARKCHLGFVQFLVSNIADQSAKDKCCAKAAKRAAGEGDFEVVQFLVSKIADQSAKDKCCVEAAKFAARKGHLKVVQFLVAIASAKSISASQSIASSSQRFREAPTLDLEHEESATPTAATAASTRQGKRGPAAVSDEPPQQISAQNCGICGSRPATTRCCDIAIENHTFCSGCCEMWHGHSARGSALTAPIIQEAEASPVQTPAQRRSDAATHHCVQCQTLEVQLRDSRTAVHSLQDEMSGLRQEIAQLQVALARQQSEKDAAVRRHQTAMASIQQIVQVATQGASPTRGFIEELLGGSTGEADPERASAPSLCAAGGSGSGSGAAATSTQSADALQRTGDSRRVSSTAVPLVRGHDITLEPPAAATVQGALADYKRNPTQCTRRRLIRKLIYSVFSTAELRDFTWTGQSRHGPNDARCARSQPQIASLSAIFAFLRIEADLADAEKEVRAMFRTVTNAARRRRHVRQPAAAASASIGKDTEAAAGSEEDDA